MICEGYVVCTSAHTQLACARLEWPAYAPNTGQFKGTRYDSHADLVPACCKPHYATGQQFAPQQLLVVSNVYRAVYQSRHLLFLLGFAGMQLLQAPTYDGLCSREHAYQEYLTKQVLQPTSDPQNQMAQQMYQQHKYQAEFLLWRVKDACGLDNVTDTTLDNYLDSTYGSKALPTNRRQAALDAWVQANAASRQPAAAGEVPDAVKLKDQQVLDVLKQAAALFRIKLFREEDLQLIKVRPCGVPMHC